MKMEASNINMNVRDRSMWMALKPVNLGASTEDQRQQFGILHCLEAGSLGRTKWFSNKPESSFSPFFKPKTNLGDLTQLKNTNQHKIISFIISINIYSIPIIFQALFQILKEQKVMELNFTKKHLLGKSIKKKEETVLMFCKGMCFRIVFLMTASYTFELLYLKQLKQK